MGVDNNMVIAREEILGPVICVIPADSDAQAIQIANDSDFGLYGTVYTDDVDRACEIARQIRSGTIGHNATRGDFSIGWGGFKQSGLGRERSVGGLPRFLRPRPLSWTARLPACWSEATNRLAAKACRFVLSISVGLSPESRAW